MGSPMRRFMVGWLAAFCGVGLVAASIGSLLQTRVPPGPGAAPPVVLRPGPGAALGKPFTQETAVDVVANRLPATRRGDQFRTELRRAATLSYHSPDHWTVRWGPASWTAHGPGRYAEPDNDAARRLESEAASGS